MIVDANIILAKLTPDLENYISEVITDNSMAIGINDLLLSFDISLSLLSIFVDHLHIKKFKLMKYLFIYSQTPAARRTMATPAR